MASLRKKIRKKFSRPYLSKMSWTVYSRAVGALSRPSDEDYVNTGIKVGRISEALNTELLDTIRSCPRRLMSISDCDPHYQHNASLEGQVDRINESFHGFDLSGSPLKVLSELCEELNPTVSQCFGTAWTVEGAKALRINHDSETIGQNTWHSDHFVPGIHKILVYLTGASVDLGTTKVVLRTGATETLEGPAGTFLLFNPTELRHKGVRPSKGERYTLELTITPSFFSNLAPVYPGQNAAYPLFPWSKYGHQRQSKKAAEAVH